jgi:hypothetical protein
MVERIFVTKKYGLTLTIILAIAWFTGMQFQEVSAASKPEEIAMPANDENSDSITANAKEGDEFLNIQGHAVNLPPDAPAFLAIIVHGVDRSRVAVIRLQNGRIMLMPSIDAIPADPRWAPDGNSLLFRSESQLMIFDFRKNRLYPFAKELSIGGSVPYAYSPDGNLIAVAQTNLVKILPKVSAQSRIKAEDYPLPHGSVFSQLLWAGDNRNLIVLVRSNDGNKRWLMRIDASAQTNTIMASNDVTALLGWDSTTGGLVIARANQKRLGNEAVTILSSGDRKPIHKMEEDDAGEFVVAFRHKTRETIAMLGREDLGEAIRLLILPPGNTRKRQWLTPFPKLSELSLSTDGNWAAFVDNTPMDDSGDVGGHIYIVPFGSENALLVLEAKPESYAFSTPIFSPK